MCPFFLGVCFDLDTQANTSCVLVILLIGNINIILLILNVGTAAFTFEDRDYSASEKEEIVNALYSLSGNIEAGNIITARDENDQQVRN